MEHTMVQAMSGLVKRTAAALAAAALVAASAAVPAAPAAEAAGNAISIWPLSGTATPDTINSYFGPRLRISINKYEFHPGIDLAAAEGTPVYATAAGKVRLLTDANGCKIDTANTTAPAGCTPLYPGGGMIVQLDHGNSLYTNYMHLSSQAAGLTTGATVALAQQVGSVGHTGDTTFDHLHFEVRDGSYLSASVKNPLGYLPRTVNAAPTVAQASAASTGAGVAKVTASVQAQPADTDINVIRVRSRDVNGAVVFEKLASFNDKINCGTNTASVNGVTWDPQAFNRYSSILTINVSFDGVSAPAGGTIEVLVMDVSGQSSTATVPAP